MQTVYDADGNALGQIPISEKQQAALAAGASVIIAYQTPQLLRGSIGDVRGSFGVRKGGERLAADNADSVRQYVALQEAIAALREKT
jgi:hypothetical protein